MIPLFLFLFSMICSSSFTMEKPVSKPFYAPHEIFVDASLQVASDHLKRLEGMLDRHTFAPEHMAYLLKQAMGDKQFDREFMASFVLLLQHGAPVDVEIDLGPYIGDGKQKATPLEIALMYHPAYAKPLLLFGAKLNAQQVKKMQPYFQKPENQLYIQDCNMMVQKRGNHVVSFLRSQTTGKPVPLARARQRFAHEILRCSTYKEAVCHEDHEALKDLLAQPFTGSPAEKTTQLTFALDEAVGLEDIEAIDELVKHNAPIVQRMSYFFMDHPRLIVHCARNNYITLEDLNKYKARMPEKRGVARFGDNENTFKAEKEATLAAIETAQRLLERPMAEVVVSNKKAKEEKKDGQL